MKLIPLTQGKFAKVDDADFDWLNQWKWFAKKNTHLKNFRTFYACRSDYSTGKVKRLYMHKILVPRFAIVAHRDDDGLNNQRANLRGGTNQQNSAARRSLKFYRGVERFGCKWRAKIRHARKDFHLGMFATAKLAALAYDGAARLLNGDWARLNFPHLPARHPHRITYAFTHDKKALIPTCELPEV